MLHSTAQYKAIITWPIIKLVQTINDNNIEHENNWIFYFQICSSYNYRNALITTLKEKANKSQYKYNKLGTSTTLNVLAAPVPT